MTPILHRSLMSPYAQKIMALMGYLDQDYLSFVAPKGLPRPVEAALVGAYARRIPVLQIGADLYCDSELIAKVLADRAGDRALFAYPDPEAAWDWIARIESEANAMVAVLSPWELIRGYCRNMPPWHVWRFLTDRAKLARRVGRPGAVLDQEQKEEDARRWLETLNAQMASHRFLMGEAVTSVDFTAFTMVWYHHKLNRLRLAGGLDHLHRWFAEMQTFGTGRSTKISGAQALEVARATDPAPIPTHMTCSDRIGQQIAHVNGGFQAGMNDPVQGRLVGEDNNCLILRRDHPELGALHVHFPKLWY